MRVLVLDNVFLQLRKIEFGRRVGECGARVLREELIDHFGEKLVGNEAGIVWVADYNSGNAFGAAVGMECVGCFSSSSYERRRREGEVLRLYIFLRYPAVDRVLYALQQSG